MAKLEFMVSLLVWTAKHYDGLELKLPRLLAWDQVRGREQPDAEVQDQRATRALGMLWAAKIPSWEDGVGAQSNGGDGQAVRPAPSPRNPQGA